MKVVGKLLEALAYIHDKDVRLQLERVFDAHRRDLEDVGYEESSETEEALQDLESAMNRYDKRAAAQRAEKK